MTGRIAALAVLLAGGLCAASTQTTAVVAHELPLFSISKSENKNQVQYAIRVDDQCAPLGNAPIFAYWRMLELAPTRTAPLLERELSAYGLASQSVLSQDASRGKVRLVLRAVPRRAILVETFRSTNGACRALSTVSIGSAPAHLYNVHAKVKWPVGVDYLLLQGWSIDGTRVVTEILRP